MIATYIYKKKKDATQKSTPPKITWWMGSSDFNAVANIEVSSNEAQEYIIRRKLYTWDIAFLPFWLVH